MQLEQLPERHWKSTGMCASMAASRILLFGATLKLRVTPSAKFRVT